MSKINHAQMEPIEKASLDELQALQLRRMKWRLQHALDNFAHYRKRFKDAGVDP
jgi:phenylacetate-CoA ligase